MQQNGGSAKQGQLILLLGGLTMLGPLSIDFYLPALPVIRGDLGVGEAQSSVAAFLAGMAVGQVIYGSASDRFGRRPSILIGLALYIVASALCGLAETYGQLLAGRFVQALGACAGGVVARAVVRDRFDHTETARVLSLMMLVSGLAPVFAPLLGGFVLHAAGWRPIFGVLSAFGIAIWCLAFFRLFESRSVETAAQARSETVVRSYVSLFSQPRLVGYAMAGALNGAMLFTYVACSPDLLINHYRIPAAHFGWVFSVNAVGLILGGYLNRRLLRSRTPDQVLRRSTAAAVALCAVLAAVVFSGYDQRWAVLTLLFLLISTYGLLQGNTVAGALAIDPRRAGATSAILGACSFATGAAASWLAGLLSDGSARALAGTLLVAAIGSATALRFAAPKDAPPV